MRIYNAALGEYTRLYIANVEMTHDEVIALGADPSRAERYDDVQMDAVVEVDRAGNVIWEWRFSDHLIQGFVARQEEPCRRGQDHGGLPGAA